MIDNLLIWALWPLGIFAVLQLVKRLPPFRGPVEVRLSGKAASLRASVDGLTVQPAGAMHPYLDTLPILIGAATGPWGAPWLISSLDAYSVPPIVIGVLIGAGAGLCSQGVYEVYKKRIKGLVAS